MSKNTGACKFRKVDVDQFDEDKYHDEVTEEQEKGPNVSEVTNLLNSGKNTDALTHLLNNPPMVTKNNVVKDKTTPLAVKVLSSFRSSEIEPAIKSLDEKQIDMLMKYIYYGFECQTEGSSAMLLTWHEKVFAVGGLGSIVRVLTDRKRV